MAGLRNHAALLTIALCLCSQAGRAETPQWVPETGDIDRATAQLLAKELITLVETQALRPRVQAEYDATKARLLALVDGPPSTKKRADVYFAARTMLWTLDTDGHTILWSNQQMSKWVNATRPESAEDISAVRTVAAPGQLPVLVLRPPQTTFMDTQSSRTYALALIDGIQRRIAADEPCAVVVDLGSQTGGNAWPAIAVLAPLITDANEARFADRDGSRSPIMQRSAVDISVGGPLPVSGLARFARRPLAVVITPQTASAGEMLAILLRGEPGSRTFGRATYGATTGNVPTPLPDGATVLLTTSRYAFGDAPPIRGPLVPDVPAARDDSPDTTLSQAVAWAAQTCPRSVREATETVPMVTTQ